MTAALALRPPSKPGPPGTWEELVADDLRLRRIVELLIQGHSYRSIAEELGVAYTTILRAAPQVSKFINDETRALAGHWQAVELARLESMSQRLLPHVMEDDSGEPPNPKYIASYKALVMAKLAVLTLNRQTTQLPEPARDETTETGNGALTGKAQLVGRYMELAQKLVGDIEKSGVGSGVAPEDDFDEDELDDLSTRADNSNTIDEAVILDPEPWDDEDLDTEPGVWRDGKFYPSSS